MIRRFNQAFMSRPGITAALVALFFPLIIWTWSGSRGAKTSRECARKSRYHRVVAANKPENCPAPRSPSSDYAPVEVVHVRPKIKVEENVWTETPGNKNNSVVLEGGKWEHSGINLVVYFWTNEPRQHMCVGFRNWITAHTRRRDRPVKCDVIELRTRNGILSGILCRRANPAAFSVVCLHTSV